MPKPKHSVLIRVHENIYRHSVWFSFGYEWADKRLQKCLLETIRLTEEEVSKCRPRETTGAKWIHSDRTNLSLIWISPNASAILPAMVHEAIHLSTFILESRGVPTDNITSEAMAYLVEYYVNEMFYLAGFGKYTHYKENYRP